MTSKADQEGDGLVSKNAMEPDLDFLCNVIKGRLYFATFVGSIPLQSTSSIEYFSIDQELVYRNYNMDFGPLNLAMLYRYCSLLNEKLESASRQGKQVVHFTSYEPRKRANAAFLVGGFSMIYLGKSPKEAYCSVVSDSPNDPGYLWFRDAGQEPVGQTITLLDVFGGLYRALQWNFFDFADFDVDEFEHCELFCNGGLNWIIPEKFLGFSSPVDQEGNVLHPPEMYFDYFWSNKVKTVVRLNENHYEGSRFEVAGIQHQDLCFLDGSNPPGFILNKFLEIGESTQGAVAVHCKAGLGRTGTLIAAYVIHKYGFTSREAVAWLRICRPGSVIGSQQYWLEQTTKFNRRNEKILRQPADRDIPFDQNGNVNGGFQFPIYSLKRKYWTPADKMSIAPSSAAEKVDKNYVNEMKGDNC